MDILPDTFNYITSAIQLALGPVFLLTGIAGMLNVMSGRLSRIIDRGRALRESPSLASVYSEQYIHNELNILEKRRHITSRAITMCTVAALTVCLVIVVLFTEAIFTIPLNEVVGILFILAIISLVIGLAYFLREVQLSAINVRLKD